MPNFSVPNQINPGDSLDANKAMANWNQVVTDLNAAKVDNTNIAASAGILADQLADAAKLGISGASTVRRGVVSIATQESRTNAAYGLMTTPDRIQNVVVPSNGILCVSYQALWLVPGTVDVAKAAIFIGANQLKAAGTGGAGVQEAAAPSGDGAHYAVLATFGGGLAADTNSTADATIPTNTGWVIGVTGGGNSRYIPGVANTVSPPAGGGHTEVDVDAGTYDISVQFKSSSGTVTVKNRKLRVWTIGF